MIVISDFSHVTLGYWSARCQYNVTGWDRVFVLTDYSGVAALNLWRAPPQYDLNCVDRALNKYKYKYIISQHGIDNETHM